MRTNNDALLDTAIDDPLIEPATVAAIDAAIAAGEVDNIPRGHLGMSQIGNPDERTLWLKFRWSLPDVPAPRVLRIFDLGHAIEAELARYLRMIPGVELLTEDPQTGAQFRFSYVGGHFGGSMDGAVIGLPEAPLAWHVWEAKSVADKRFAALVKAGVEAWNREYHGQLQCYMGATGMKRALFMAYNKNDSSLYTERVKMDPMFFPAMVAKAERIIAASEPPASSWPDRSWHESKWMSAPAQAVYWGDRPPRPNCRNCKDAEPVLDGTQAAWRCHAKRRELTLMEQHTGCDAHVYLPCFLTKHAEALDGGGDFIFYRHKSGRLFANGLMANFPQQSDADDSFTTFTSQELYVTDPELWGDNFVADVKNIFDARMVEPQNQLNPVTT